MRGQPSGAQGSGAEPSGRAPGLGDFFWMGTACAISIVLGGGIGYWLDSVFGITPWLTFAGLVFGMVSAVLLVVVQIRKFS